MSLPETKARDTVFAKLRKSVADLPSLFRSEDVSEPALRVPSAVTNADGRGLALAKVFGENLSAVLGSYEIVQSLADVPQSIVARIEGWRKENDGTASYGSEVLSWATHELPIPDLSGQLERHGVSLYVPKDMHDNEDREHAESLKVGLTGVDAAFAGTGSMVLVTDPGKSRAASLLPLHHIALVPVSTIFPTLESWLAKLRSEGRLEELFRDHGQLTFVTGPSKSADIELNLTLGVHGPRDVHAIVFDDSR